MGVGRACDFVYIDYVRRSRSSSYRLLRPINCQIYITLLVGFGEREVERGEWKGRIGKGGEGQGGNEKS